MAHTKEPHKSQTNLIKKWVEGALDESFARLEDVADACLKITDAFKKKFPSLQVIKDLWISQDFDEWEITVIGSDGIEQTFEGDRAKNIRMVWS